MNDFLKFSQLQIRSWDIDPTYPVLKALYVIREYTKEEALWHTFVYLTFYHLGSVEVFLERNPKPAKSIRLSEALPTGTERRGFRGRPDLVKKHLVALRNLSVEWYGIVNMVDNWAAPSRYTGWNNIREQYSALPYAGPWSSYKLADLLKWVHGYNITAPDFGVGGGGDTIGPIPGMAELTGYDWYDCANNVELQHTFYSYCCDRMKRPFKGLDQCETCLCDFNSVLQGRYYTGKDIDLQLAFLSSQNMLTTEYLNARHVSFGRKLRGEEQGWKGERKELNKYYLVHNEVYNPYEPSNN